MSKGGLAENGCVCANDADFSRRWPVDGSANSAACGEQGRLDDLPVVPAGWPVDSQEGCMRLDAAAVLRATPRSFALRVRGQSMAGVGICDGDVVVGEFTPEARPGAIVVALIDGESVLKRLVLHQGRPYLMSENPSHPGLVPLCELVIQGVVHTLVRRVR